VTIPATIDNFSVSPSNVINGASNTLIFSITTRVTIINGDVFKFTVPSQITLPATDDELEITPLPRTIDGIEVRDEMKVVTSGNLVIITFIKVAATTETYKWTLSNIQNPPSEKTSDPFTGLISVDSGSWNVQAYTVVGPTITN